MIPHLPNYPPASKMATQVLPLMHRFLNAHAAVIEGEEEYGEDFPDIEQGYITVRDELYALMEGLLGEGPTPPLPWVPGSEDGE